VVGTGLGSLGVTTGLLQAAIDRGVAGVEPAAFASSVLNEPAAQVAIEFGLRGPNLTLTHPEGAFGAALAAAVDLVRFGRADAALVGGCDELGPEIEHALARLGLLSRSGVARPFDRRRDGLVPGEAAVMALLEPAAAAARRGAAALARIAAVVLGGQPSRVVARALAEAQRSPADVDYVALGGNGTRALDRAYAELHREVFGGCEVAAASIAGATGEFGASGALRLAQALAAIGQGVLPGTIHFEQVDLTATVPGLLAGARPQVARCVLVPELTRDGGASATVLVRPG
jgi:3-oxoacyl-[acyl-carrier-protein] synthase II